MSLEVISRLTGGPNLMPLLSRNVHVLPPFVGFGIGSREIRHRQCPAAPADVVVPDQRSHEQVRVDRDDVREVLAGRVEAVGPAECRLPADAVGTALGALGLGLLRTPRTRDRR